jgi:hypothetical protein
VRAEPIALLRDGALVDVPERGDPAHAELVARHLRRGNTLQLLRAGAVAGELTLGEPFEVCEQVVSRVAGAPGAPPEGQALATDLPAGRLRAFARREPTAAERDAAEAFVRRERARRGAPAGGPERAELVALDLDGDGRAELVGTWEDETPKGRALFFLLNEVEGAWRALRVELAAATGELRDVSHLVDAVDLDGDGVAELVLRQSGWEGWSFALLRRNEGRWQLVRLAAGAVCA